jgi:RNA polymerase sigma-70 factor, ECF subfamily
VRVGTGASVAQLEALYRARYERFARVAAAVAGDVEAGHDAVQMAFANALRNRHSFRRDGPLEGWLWRIVVNEAKHIVAARRFGDDARARHDEPEANGRVTDQHGLRPWIATLPERQRAVVFLRYYADLAYAEIADVLEIDVGTVSATLSAAHTKLRNALSEVER